MLLDLPGPCPNRPFLAKRLSSKNQKKSEKKSGLYYKSDLRRDRHSLNLILLMRFLKY